MLITLALRVGVICERRRGNTKSRRLIPAGTHPTNTGHVPEPSFRNENPREEIAAIRDEIRD